MVPPVNENLRKAGRHVTPERSNLFKAIDSETLLQFILRRQVHGLIKSEKHDLRPSELESLEKALMGECHFETISAALSLGEHQEAAILATISSLVRRWVSLGTAACVDEPIFPFFGRDAFEKGVLQKIPGKPHDYGLVAYQYAQRLVWTGLPVTIDVVPAWIGNAPSPIQAAVQLLERNKVVGQTQHFIADSLWSAGYHLPYYRRLSVFFTVALKPSNNTVPPELIELASSDLPAG